MTPSCALLTTTDYTVVKDGQANLKSNIPEFTLHPDSWYPNPSGKIIKPTHWAGGLPKQQKCSFKQVCVPKTMQGEEGLHFGPPAHLCYTTLVERCPSHLFCSVPRMSWGRRMVGTKFAIRPEMLVWNEHEVRYKEPLSAQECSPEVARQTIALLFSLRFLTVDLI